MISRVTLVSNRNAAHELWPLGPVFLKSSRTALLQSDLRANGLLCITVTGQSVCLLDAEGSPVVQAHTFDLVLQYSCRQLLRCELMPMNIPSFRNTTNRSTIMIGFGYIHNKLKHSSSFTASKQGRPPSISFSYAPGVRDQLLPTWCAHMSATRPLRSRRCRSTRRSNQ